MCIEMFNVALEMASKHAANLPISRYLTKESSKRLNFEMLHPVIGADGSTSVAVASNVRSEFSVLYTVVI